MGKARRVKDGGMLHYDMRLMGQLAELKERVENPNKHRGVIVLIGRQMIDPMQPNDKDFEWERYHGFLIGYQIQEVYPFNGMFKRYVWIACPNEDIGEIPEDERKPIVASVSQILLEQGAGEVEACVPSKESIMFVQDFQPIYLHEWKPNLVMPGDPVSKAKVN